MGLGRRRTRRDDPRFHLGAGTVVEPAAIVCDSSRVGAGSIVRAGTCVKQRARFGEQAVLDGFPADQVGTLEAAPSRPAWASTPATCPHPSRSRRDPHAVATAAHRHRSGNAHPEPA